MLVNGKLNTVLEHTVKSSCRVSVWTPAIRVHAVAAATRS